MPRSTGFITITGPAGICREAETITCSHCQKIMPLEPRPRKGRELNYGHCMVCDLPICLPCVDHGTCTPWEKQMESQEQAFQNAMNTDRFYRDVKAN